MTVRINSRQNNNAGICRNIVNCVINWILRDTSGALPIWYAYILTYSACSIQNRFMLFGSTTARAQTCLLDTDVGRYRNKRFCLICQQLSTLLLLRLQAVWFYYCCAHLSHLSINQSIKTHFYSAVCRERIMSLAKLLKPRNNYC